MWKLIKTFGKSQKLRKNVLKSFFALNKKKKLFNYATGNGFINISFVHVNRKYSNEKASLNSFLIGILRKFSSRNKFSCNLSNIFQADAVANGSVGIDK